MSEYIVRETGYPGAVKQEIVQELVRCKDCEYWREGSGIFDFSPYCELTATKCDGEHFCSWGEKSVLRNQN